MTEDIVFDQLKRDVADQARVRDTYKYFNATDHSKSLYDEAIKMGEELLDEHQKGHNEPQAMVDLVDQAIYNSRKALNGQETDKHALDTQLTRAGQFLRSQEFTGLPIKTQQYWEREIASAHKMEAADSTDQEMSNKAAVKLSMMFDKMEQMRPQLIKEAAQQRAIRAQKALAARKKAEKERKKRDAILAKQKALAEKAARKHREQEKRSSAKPQKRGEFWSFFNFLKK